MCQNIKKVIKVFNKKMFKILIMGLPGSGKTTLAKELIKTTKAYWLNADKVRKNTMIGTFLERVFLVKQKGWQN